MTKHQHKGAGGYDRRAVMKDAHKRYLSRQQPGEIALTWAQCLRTAWQATRIRQERDIHATMRRIAGMIDDHLSRRITLAPEIVAGMKSQMIAQRGAIL
jgi:hypothetical protein